MVGIAEVVIFDTAPVRTNAKLKINIQINYKFLTGKNLHGTIDLKRLHVHCFNVQRQFSNVMLRTSITAYT